MSYIGSKITLAGYRNPTPPPEPPKGSGPKGPSYLDCVVLVLFCFVAALIFVGVMAIIAGPMLLATDFMKSTGVTFFSVLAVVAAAIWGLAGLACLLKFLNSSP